MKSLGQILSDKTLLKTGFCNKHGEYQSMPTPNGGIYCPHCVRDSIEAEKDRVAHENASVRQQGKLRAIVGRSGIPPRFQSKTFDTFVPEDDKQARVLRICKAYAERFEERYAAGGGLVLCGMPGTGKTHLVAAIANHILEKDQNDTLLFISAMSAVRRVKQTFGKESNETEAQAIAKFYEPRLLMLDEVGVQYGSDAERIILFEIINGRYERVLPTILISNLPEDELGEFVSDRVMDRMREGGGVVLAFDWPSKRQSIKTASRDMPTWAKA